MNKYILMGLVAISVVACSDSKSKKGSGPAAPVRTAEHKPAECPADVAGTYAANGDTEETTVIEFVNGGLVFRDADAGDLPVDGTVHVAKDDGSSASCICKGGKLELVSVAKNGTKSEFTLTKNGKNLDVVGVQAGEKQAVQLIRIKEAAVTNTVPVETSPVEKPQTEIPEIPAIPEIPELGGQTPAMPQMPVMPEIPKIPQEAANKCGSGTSYTYQISVNGCSTGVQTFCSKSEYCEGLKNETLNKGCGLISRMEKYQATCN